MKYWFKRKRYGYGWTPVTWQGWTAVGIYVVLLLFGAGFLSRNQGDPALEDVLVFLVVFFVATGTLLAVTHYFAPKARWRWGKRLDDNPEEDY